MMQVMNNYPFTFPKIGIRPTIDGRLGGVRESLDEITMNMAKRVAALYSKELRNPDGSSVECVIADTKHWRRARSGCLRSKIPT